MNLKLKKVNFEIVRWPINGSRPLDPDTGDEAGTTEGYFDVEWKGKFFYGKNLAVSTTNNYYLDGLGTHPDTPMDDTADLIYLWMSDYHPDGAQLFWPEKSIPFVVTLGLNTKR